MHKICASDISYRQNAEFLKGIFGEFLECLKDRFCLVGVIRESRRGSLEPAGVRGHDFASLHGVPTGSTIVVLPKHLSGQLGSGILTGMSLDKPDGLYPDEVPSPKRGRTDDRLVATSL